MSTVSVTPADSPTPLWRNVGFLLMWSSIAASGFGARLIQLGAWEMLGIGRGQAASIQAATSFFFLLPYVLFGPTGGWIADTLPRKWVMFSCDEIRGVILLIAALLVPTGLQAGDPKLAIPDDMIWFSVGSFALPKVAQVYFMIFLVGTLAAVFSPTKQATVPQIVPRSQLQSANAIILGIATIASLIGLGVGGWMMKAWSVRAGLMTAMLTFLISGSFFIFLKPRGHVPVGGDERAGQLKRMIQAFGYIRRHRPLIGLIFVSLMFWSAAHVFLAVIAALCNKVYLFRPDQMTTAIAVMQMTVGVGMLTSALWVAWIGSRRESAWVALASLVLAGACMIAMRFLPWYEVGLVFAFAAGFCGNTAMICVATLTQSITPNYIRGRVFGVRDLVILFASVAVNGVIWQLPDADKTMLEVLVPLGLILSAVSAIGLWRQMTRAPHPHSRFLSWLWRVNRAFVLAWHKLTWTGRHHVPDTGAVLIAANHTTGLDPFLIQAAIPRVVRWVMTTPYRFKVLAPMWRAIRPIALDLDKGNLGNLRQVMDALKAGEPVGIFPEGALQRDRRDLAPFRPGIGMIARRSGALILPVWISGTPRKKSILWHFLWPSRSTVTFGEPYQPDKNATNEEVVEELRRRLMALSDRVQGPR